MRIQSLVAVTISVLVWVAALLPLPAAAGMQEVTVTGIGVHDDIEQAQMMAADYAKKRALYEIALKWNVPDLDAKMKRLDALTMAQAIRGSRVIDFKREKNILYTKTVVSVLDTPLKRALKVPLDIASTTARGLGVLVIPVFKDGEQLLLWDKKNPLRAPMRRVALTHGSQSVLVPLGDAKDMAEIGADNIMQARFEEFKGLLSRYSAKEVMVVVFTLPEEESAVTRVLVNRIFDGGMKPEILDIKAKEKEPMPARYHDIAVTVVKMAAERAAATAQEQRAKRTKFTAQPLVFRFTTMREYGELSEVLRSTTLIKELEIDTIALQEVTAVLYHADKAADIRAYLDKKGVKLREEGGIWAVSLR